MNMTFPDPDKLDDYLLDPTHEAELSRVQARRDSVKAEGAIASKYWGGIQWRIVVTFSINAVLWTSVLVLGLNGMIPLWAGLIVNTVLAATFYMPMHEAVHKNIWGKVARGRVVEEIIGMLCSVPLLMPFRNHRASHMRHHAYTNDPDRDPDYFSQGELRELPVKFLSVTFINALLPLFAFIPPMRKLLHPAMVRANQASANKTEGLMQLRFWLITHGVLLAAVLTGFGWQAFLLWYLPARLQLFWLAFVFAWYPHHPGNKQGRYVDTRVAVFPGSTFLIRGHDHHALHHLFPRVAHYRLPAMWQEMATDLVGKGVRAEGRALEATGPVVW
jgi:beta-carotene hydroxylase